MADYGDITVEIVEHIGVLSKNDDNGWTMECNLVAWNGKPAKIDVRQWSPDHTRMARGLTLSEEQAEKLAMCLGQRMMKRQREHKEKDLFER